MIIVSKESAQLVHGSYGETMAKVGISSLPWDDDPLGSAGKSPELLISHGFSHQELR